MSRPQWRGRVDRIGDRRSNDRSAKSNQSSFFRRLELPRIVAVRFAELVSNRSGQRGGYEQHLRRRRFPREEQDRAGSRCRKREGKRCIPEKRNPRRCGDADPERQSERHERLARLHDSGLGFRHGERSTSNVDEDERRGQPRNRVKKRKAVGAMGR